MPINAGPNPNFVGATRVSDKYNPLARLALQPADSQACSTMLTNRRATLAGMNVALGPLALLLPITWEAAYQSEAGKSPPLVVVSSNRSQWIRQGIDAAQARLQSLGIDNFDSVNDLRALTVPGEPLVSPPIYLPKRIGPVGQTRTRNVYIVVHITEYQTYKDALEGTGITVVGWQFGEPWRQKKDRADYFAGFGVTRFAAIQLLKELMRDPRVVWTKAWLFDDNVVALENFAGLADFENQMADNVIAIGFRGSNSKSSHTQDVNWARVAVPTNRLPGFSTRGRILQQAVLWNLEVLTRSNLNFPLVYLASAEDLSFSRYFDRQNISYRVYDDPGQGARGRAGRTAVKVRKEETTYNTGRGVVGLVERSKLACQGRFAGEESAPNAGLLPPPVEIRAPGSPAQTAWQFMASVLGAGTTNNNARAEAACMAVEQITKTALNQANIVTAPALQQTFEFANGNSPAVQRRGPV